MRMSDWSSDVCSSDLPTRTAREALARWPPTSTLPASTACLARLRVRKNRAAQSQMSSLAVPVLTCVHDSASLQFARILARVAVKKRLHQVSASRRDDARGRGRRKRKRLPGGGRSCTGCGEDYSAAGSAEHG